MVHSVVLQTGGSLIFYDDDDTFVNFRLGQQRIAGLHLAIEFYRFMISSLAVFRIYRTVGLFKYDTLLERDVRTQELDG